ncbi:MAG TPA: SGNH/GDSL hydrolase family protein [Acidobacteriaceae bacterium]|nr:SGNH/GDSL hydrolase family protein [Acidobacteriaceae bacterium]
MRLFCCLLLLVPFAAAQTTSTPATTPQAASQAAPATHPESEYQRKHDQQLLTDFGDLARYSEANAKLAPPAPGEKRVVFMGDSITDAWGHPTGEFFPGKPYINRGISGQTTPQMLVRFWPDVIALQPKVVVILAGTNDIAGNTGPTTPTSIEDNLMAMTDLARANGIRMVMASILPAATYPWQPGTDPRAEIAAINNWIRDYCEKKNFVYLDYYSAMVNSDQGMKKELTIDGVHPNAEGYKVMTPLAEAAIAEALKTK